jgi:cytochrome c-type biogenesis protein CcmH/NrfG
MHRSFAVVAAAAVLAALIMAWTGAGRLDGASPGAPANAGIPRLEALTARDPDNFEAWKQLARAYRAQGRQRAAAEAYIRAARISPTDPETIAALQDLASAYR